MTLMRWEPTTRNIWPELAGNRRFFEPFEEMIERMIGTPRESSFPVDMVEEGDKYVLKAELPGVKSEDIKISVDNDVLTVTSEKKNFMEGKEEGVYRQECCYGSCSRSFRLGGMVNTDKIEAEYKDGVLSLSLPKKEEVKGRQVQIRVK
jgi:HSP20 family protein